MLALTENYNTTLSFHTSPLIKESKPNPVTEDFEHISNTYIIHRLTAIQRLKDNWDGHGAVAIERDVIYNSRHLLTNLYPQFLKKLKADDITPTPYGTLVLDWENHQEELVSVEIGKSSIGFFTDFADTNKNIIKDKLSLEEAFLHINSVLAMIY